MLTKDQQKAYEVLQDFILNSPKQTALLEGKAGTGKGFLIQHLMESLPNVRFFCSATTNKAASVQAMQAEKAGTSLEDVGTIYSLLGLRLTPSGEVKVINRGGTSTFGAYQVVIIDEISMANDQLIQHLMEDLRSSPTKVIMVGDRSQLPPVNQEGISGAFDIPDIRLSLTQVVRQAEGSPILKLASDLRESIEQGETLYKFETSVDEKGEGVFILDRETWKRWMRQGFQSDKYKQDVNAFKTIAWRNVTVNALNTMIRAAIYGDEAQQGFIKGEKVLTAAPIVEDGHTEATTDTTGTILSVSLATHPSSLVLFYGEFKVWEMVVAFDSGSTCVVRALHSDSKRLYDRTLEGLAGDAKKDYRLWSTFHEFRDSFNDIRYAHAITSHRSQGSTYTNVFVDVEDIKKNPNWEEGMKSLYVACTRASNNLMLYV